MITPPSESNEQRSRDAMLRFDDMLATVLGQSMEDGVARVIAWRQIVDLIGQRRSGGDDPVQDAGFDLLHAVRADVPAETRAEVARSIAGRPLPAELVAFFANDTPAIAAIVLSRAVLPDAAWLALLPTFSPTARGVLRNRRDLSVAVVRALASFGSCDLVLDGPAHTVKIATDVEGDAAGRAAEPSALPVVPPPAMAPADALEVRALLARIDARRSAGSTGRGAVEGDPIVAPDPEVRCFRFETGTDGVILWVEDAPRGPLIGISLAVAADPLDYGIDGQVAGAFRQRERFRDARLTVGGAGPVSGAWRISGVPFFDPADGRFLGYRGAARRPRADETAAPSASSAGLHGSALPADSLRQLVHELRTPLNAIVGFAEMIERQILGPAGGGYRVQAADIAAHGRRLLSTVEDLDISAGLETQRLSLEAGPVDATVLLARLWPDYERVGRGGGVKLAIVVANVLPPIHGDVVAVERMFSRLLAATIGLAETGERVEVGLDAGSDAAHRFVALRVTRPRQLAGRGEGALLDPGYSPEGDWPDAPVLGLGFALRLIRNLATVAGGSLEIGEGAFVLRLPARQEGLLSGTV